MIAAEGRGVLVLLGDAHDTEATLARIRERGLQPADVGILPGAAGGLRMTNDVVVAIAAQACLPVLRLGLARYDGFVGIVVHPDQVLARREVADDDGIVHSYDAANPVLTVKTQLGGDLQVDMRTGAYTYGAPGELSTAATETTAA